MVQPLRNALLDAAAVFMFLSMATQLNLQQAFLVCAYVFVGCWLFWLSLDSHKRATNPEYRALARIRDTTHAGS